MLARLTRLVETLGVNALPLGGVLAGGWSEATALSLYWCENLAAGLFVALRLWLYHRWNPDVPMSTNRLQQPGQFFLTTLAFTLAHGLFLAVLFVTVIEAGPEVDRLQAAVLPLVAVQAVAFGVDLWTLAAWPAARVTSEADYLLGRVVLVHVSLLVGVFLQAAFAHPWAFFACFATLKGLADLARFIPTPWTVAAPPPRR